MPSKSGSSKSLSIGDRYNLNANITETETAVFTSNYSKYNNLSNYSNSGTDLNIKATRSYSIQGRDKGYHSMSNLSDNSSKRRLTGTELLLKAQNRINRNKKIKKQSMASLMKQGLIKRRVHTAMKVKISFLNDDNVMKMPAYFDDDQKEIKRL